MTDHDGASGRAHPARRPGEVAGCDPRLVDRLLATLEHDIIPLTRAGVGQGNKVFGAAILRKEDLALVVAGTNHETENPLWHGEIHTIKTLYEMPREQRPMPKDCIFLASHEPCTLCLSAITWGGYDNFYYLYSHEDSRDSFNIGHDLLILEQLFRLSPGEYARANSYWNGYSLIDLINNCDDAMKKDFMARVAHIKAAYDEMSEIYQASKNGTDIPFK
jgi:tRNA(Arg) A34 adenosine deaminase TadA